MMDAAATGFYVTGGTLRPDAPSYVERQADGDLHDALSRGEFCYVLTARQMGKSSLMVHTASRLRKAGVAVAVLDLTAVGQNLSTEQWYDGLLRVLGWQLDCEEPLEEFWLANARMGPLQRWMLALREVVLDRVHAPLVIFIDEIDAVRSLPFPTDEFFAAVRHCYTQRTQDPEFQRLTFCLLGVASPTDLIRDTRTTPFNIGRRIELTDFKETDAASLAVGLAAEEDSPPASLEAQRYAEVRREGTDEAQLLLQRVLYWTGGHPYLTQRLCRSIAEAKRTPAPISLSSSPSAPLAKRAVKLSPSQIADHLCDELFLSPSARERDDNLIFVREQLLRSGADLASLLDLYATVWRGRPVTDDETNPLVSLLRLSGIVRAADGRLQVRNRIYARVFDREWIAGRMPDAEVRRQRAAFRRGLIRAATVATLVVAVVGGLALTATNQASIARRATAQAVAQRHTAQEGQRSLRRHLYVAQMNLALRAWEDGDSDHTLDLLKAQQPAPGQEDLRGFEWRYLSRLSARRDDRFTWRGGAPAFSPDGKFLAMTSSDGTVKLWNRASQREVATLTRVRAPYRQLRFSPDGKTLVIMGSEESGRLTVSRLDLGTRRESMPFTVRTPVPLYGYRATLSHDGKTLIAANKSGSVTLWDTATGRESATLAAGRDEGPKALSPDGKFLAVAASANSVELWDLATRRASGTLKGHTTYVAEMLFSPDGRTVATGSDDTTVRLWDFATRREVGILRGHRSGVYALAFSPDGRTLVSGGDDGAVKLWDVADRQELETFRGHRGSIDFAQFSPDARTLLTSGSGVVTLWNVARRERDTLRGHIGGVTGLTFSPDSKTLVSGGWDRTVRLWNVATERERATLKGHGQDVFDVALSPDGKTVASASGDQTVKVWDTVSRRAVATLRGHRDEVAIVRFSPDGKLLATGGHDNTIRLWDVATWREADPPLKSPRGFAPHNHNLAFSPDGKRLAAASGIFSNLELWDRSARRAVATLQGKDRSFLGIAFSPDGKTLASAGSDRVVTLWNAADPPFGVVAQLKGHAGEVVVVAWSPDGKRVASAGYDLTVRLWDPAMEREVATLRGHTTPIFALAFSPDGNTLASGSADGRVRLWRADPGPGRPAP